MRSIYQNAEPLTEGLPSLLGDEIRKLTGARPFARFVDCAMQRRGGLEDDVDKV